jgi:predicted phage terminase large subunit-like protein
MRRSLSYAIAYAPPPDPTTAALAARTDLGLFGEYVVGKKPATHHQRWLPILAPGKDSECLRFVAGPNTDLLAPRGSAKSTWAAITAAFVIGHNPGMQMLYLSNSDRIALRQSRLIKRIIETPRYQEVFPLIRPGRRWADTDWEIDKAFAGVSTLDSDTTFSAFGILSSIIGQRTWFIFCDDLIKSSQAIANPDIREKISQNFSEVIEPTLVPGGRILSLGTRFLRDDIHVTDFSPQNGWVSIEESAILTNPETGEEESYWPERYRLEALQHIREKKPLIFLYQYQNKIPPPDEDVVIHPDWIKYGEIPQQFDALCVGLDLASSLKEKNDFTAFVLCGRVGNRFYVLDMRRGRWVGNIEKLDQLIELWEEWDECPMMLSAEGVAYQSSLKGDFTQYLVGEKQIYNISYHQPQTRGDKLQRLKGVSGLFENDLVTFNQYRKLGRLTLELTGFGAEDHDDCADALVYALVGLMGRRKLEVA